MQPTPEQMLAWCKEFSIDPNDESQRAGVEGSLTDIAEGRTPIPAFMEGVDLWSDVVDAHNLVPKPEVPNGPVV